MEASLTIAKIREDGAKKREEMLNDRARHEAKRRGDDGTEPVGIRSMINAERSKRRHAELRIFKHPKMVQSKEKSKCHDCKSDAASLISWENETETTKKM